MLDGLAVELLHNIFSHLDLEGVLAARATCSLLAAVGSDHVLENEVLAYYHIDKSRQLTEIAKHPTFFKRITSFYLQGDRFIGSVAFDQ